MSVTRLFDLLDNYKKNYGNKQDALAAKVNGQWVKYSVDDFIENSTFLAYAFINLGLQPGDKVALIANNRPEWNFSDFGMQMAGVINVPIYPTISNNDLKFILNDAEIKYVLVSNKDLFNKVKAVISETPTVKDIYTFDKVDGAKHYSELINSGKHNP